MEGKHSDEQKVVSEKELGPGPSPHEVVSAAQLPHREQEIHRTRCPDHETDEGPPTKRQRQDEWTDYGERPVTTSIPLVATIPLSSFQPDTPFEPETPYAKAETPRHLPNVQRAQSSSSVSSELSSDREQATSSPVAPCIQEVPPAPPSTPASQPHAIYTLDGLETPLPVLENASILEQQQMLAEGAETPAPTRQNEDESMKHAPSLPEDFSEWAVGDRYRLIRMLGRGSYGQVAQAIDLRAGRDDAFVAIKRIQSPFDQEVDAVRLYREIHILRRMRGHSCIMQLLDIVQPPTDDINDFHDLYLVCEYVDTDLYKLILSPQYLSTEHIQTFMYQMLTGLKYVHSCSVIHRDLKPANILLNEDCSLKICDFGLARIVDNTRMSCSKGTATDTVDSKAGRRSHAISFGSPPKTNLTRQLTKHVVTRWYRAPELILLQPYTSAVDMWSLGCILAELLSMQDGNVASYQDRQPLFPGGTCYPLSGEGDSIKKDERLDQLSVIFGVIGTPSNEDIDAVGKANEYISSLGHIKGKSLNDLYPKSEKTALDLLQQMLQFNPSKRCTADDALEHVFFKEVRRKEVEIVADGPLEGPDFLETHQVDLQVVKEKTFEEVRWFGQHR